MDWTTTAVKLALDSLKSAIKRIGSTVSRHKQRQLTSTAIMELLKLDPDMDAVDAALAAAEATGIDPSPDLFRAKRMRNRVVKHPKKARKIMTTKKKVAAIKKITMTKATRKRAVKTKVVKKKTTKKGAKAKR